MPARYDAVIIGAGVIGCCVAFELAKRGWKTLNLDRLPAAGYGSTSYSCAIIRTHYSTFTGTAMAYEGYHIWRDWAGYVGGADENGSAQYRETGCLALKTKGNNNLNAVRGHSAALGIPMQDWTASQIRERYPYLDLTQYAPAKLPDHPRFGEPTGGEIAGAVYFPKAGYVNDPQLAAHNAQRAAEALGARFTFNAQVTEIRRHQGRVQGVTLADGQAFDAAVVINVGGPHSMKINALAGVEDDMNITSRALRQEVAYLPPPPGVDFGENGFIFTDEDLGCYAKPETGNKMAVGSQNPACDPNDYVDYDNFNENLTEQAEAQVYRLAQRMPTLGIPGHLSGVVACYDQTPDWIPIYDKTRLDGYFIAAGTSGNQFKNAPVAGAVMAALVEACSQGRDHDADPVSFHLPHIDKEIDLSFFSRKRIINEESSFSVLG
ncbi:MAG: FAD-binding oxidoreductase [Rhodospirillales bacterium]|nr:FAD-binding oxidoreductase [Rhodospirillales bacterium]